MDWIWYLFAFAGRVNRARMWLAALIIVCWMLILGFAVLGVSTWFGMPVKSVHYSINDIFRIVDPDSLRAAVALLRNGKDISAGKLVLGLVHLIAALLFLWVYMAASIKRLHDRNRSGWWMIAFLAVPGLFEQFADRIDDILAAGLLGLTSAALLIWGGIELFFLPGVRGDNRYGSDPLTPVPYRRPAVTYRP